jgi:hypothetical protein
LFLSSKAHEKEGLRRLLSGGPVMAWAMWYSHGTFPCGASSGIEQSS